MITLMNKRRSNKKGFTLIELLVVLAILAIIALIAVPNFIGVRQGAEEKADIQTAEMFVKAVELALIAEETAIPSAGATVCTVTGSDFAVPATNPIMTKANLSKYIDTSFEVQHFTNIVISVSGDGKVTYATN